MEPPKVYAPSVKTLGLGDAHVVIAQAVIQELFGPPEERFWAVRPSGPQRGRWS
jgi:hypothetical protein